MSDKIKDGGQAFPRTGSDFIGYPGMTLRDYFAGQALAGTLSDGVLVDPDNTAKWAYQYADAMIDAREAAK